MFEDKIKIDDIVIEGDLVKWSKNGNDYVHEVVDISDNNNPIIEFNSQEVELIR